MDRLRTHQWIDSTNTVSPGEVQQQQTSTAQHESGSTPHAAVDRLHKHRSPGEVQYRNETSTRTADILDSTGQTEGSRDGPTDRSQFGQSRAAQQQSGLHSGSAQFGKFESRAAAVGAAQRQHTVREAREPRSSSQGCTAAAHSSASSRATQQPSRRHSGRAQFGKLKSQRTVREVREPRSSSQGGTAAAHSSGSPRAVQQQSRLHSGSAQSWRDEGSRQAGTVQAAYTETTTI